MRKLNIFIIVWDHLKTLRDERRGNISIPDVLIFFGLPLLMSIAYYLFPIFSIPKDIIGSLIAIFSIFSALLFSAQIALYSLAPKPPDNADDDIINQQRLKRFNRQRSFFKDVNANTSYLILLSCLALVAFLIIKISDLSEELKGAILILLVTHFFLTLLMLIKRTHIAFSLGHDL